MRRFSALRRAAPLALLLLLAPATAAAGATRSFASADDGWVNARGPGGGHGTGPRLLVGGPARRRAYLRFAVTGFTAPPREVTLVLRSLSARSRGRLALRAVRPRAWRERTLTRRSGPRLESTLRRRTVRGRGSVALDLTRRVHRNGTFTFALTSRSRRALAFASSEDAHGRAPRLVVTGVGEESAAPGSGPQGGPSPLSAGGGDGDGNGEKAVTRPASSPVLSDTAAAAHVQFAAEIRPNNTTANHTAPRGGELDDFHSASREPYTSLVTGNFVGTTDEIIQWAAWKWGVDEDVIRAAAVQESDWYQDEAGDGGASFGLMQVKTQLAGGGDGWAGTYPLARDSTPFNADYYGRAFRSCYDGRETWLGGGYAAGDASGCVGFWFSGGWHDRGAEDYLSKVEQWLAERTWEKPGY